MILDVVEVLNLDRPTFVSGDGTMARRRHAHAGKAAERFPTELIAGDHWVLVAVARHRRAASRRAPDRQVAHHAPRGVADTRARTRWRDRPRAADGARIAACRVANMRRRITAAVDAREHAWGRFDRGWRQPGELVSPQEIDIPVAVHVEALAEGEPLGAGRQAVRARADAGAASHRQSRQGAAEQFGADPEGNTQDAATRPERAGR